ncbi:NADPH:quinone reductase [Amycolatopsis sp. WAC 01416]|uniref:NADP-dependent oxidoreductase n=1 Tax=Amycolatopsis sp. WAC 01416 TaxID=2203196 RepID=UPI000F7993ED|nr:NADP-dependent oxidoreductase [Amycolatopsis sp. WAC 01416]RSN23687.1 NADPH:quinone reductase [Amycolatopsis sp. WAC 01416]
MRVVTQQRLGGPEVLEVTETDRPSPGPTEVLVRVRAAGINPVDWKTRAYGVFMGEPPFVLGWDVSGVVEELGVGTTRFVVGDEVLGFPWFPRQAGGYGEYVTAPARQFVRKPANLTHEQAAGLPLAGLTAWQGLVDIADVQPGQRVLIDAAAGGVGHLAVQVAKARGAYVLGTASAGKHDFLRGLGVDEPIDYRDETATAAGVDVVFGLVGERSDLRWLDAVKPGGLLVSVPGGVSEAVAAKAEKLGVRTSGMLAEPDEIGLLALTGLIEKGELRVHVDQTFPLEDVTKAHEVGEGGRVTGKLVLTL